MATDEVILNMPNYPEIDLAMVPEHMQAGVKRYLVDGILSGHFLRAVFENDLVEAVCRADDENLARLRDWALFLYNEMPLNSWGSKEKVKSWCENRLKERDL